STEYKTKILDLFLEIQNETNLDNKKQYIIDLINKVKKFDPNFENIIKITKKYFFLHKYLNTNNNNQLRAFTQYSAEDNNLFNNLYEDIINKVLIFMLNSDVMLRRNIFMKFNSTIITQDIDVILEQNELQNMALRGPNRLINLFDKQYAILKNLTSEAIKTFGNAIKKVKNISIENFSMFQLGGNFKKRAKIENIKLEIVDTLEYELQSQTKLKNGKYVLTMRMSKGLYDLLIRLKKVINQETYEELIKQLFLHEKIEYFALLNGMNLKKAHTLALNTAGDKQFGLIKSLEIIDEIKGYKHQNLEFEGIKKLQENIYKISNLLNISIEDLYKIFPDILKKLKNNINQLKNEGIEIIIDITGNTAQEIIATLEKLDIKNKIGVRVILIGEPNLADIKNRINISRLMNYIEMRNHILLKIEMVIGKEMYNQITTKNENIEKIYGRLIRKGLLRVSTVRMNGQLVTGNGMVTEKLYNLIRDRVKQLIQNYNLENISEKIVDIILNNEFLQNKYTDEILKEYFNEANTIPTQKVRQLIIKKESLSKKELKKYGINIFKKVETDTKDVIIIDQVLETGLLLREELDISRFQKLKDGLELKPNEKDVASVEIVKPELILTELAGISENQFKLKMKRVLFKVMVKIGIEKIVIQNIPKNMDLNIEKLKALAWSA
ncbi:MAG: hypothetical protein LBF97_07970, partial [Elusimicrobiota bacterium]|nr:hypothetical protein [Elusimicrobiota bacterium]